MCKEADNFEAGPEAERFEGNVRQGLHNTKADFVGLSDAGLGAVGGDIGTGIGAMREFFRRNVLKEFGFKAMYTFKKNARPLGRAMVCLYFLNIVVDALEVYGQQTYSTGGGRLSHEYKFPFLIVCGLGPAAVIVALNWGNGWIAWASAWLLVVHICQHDLKGMYKLVSLMYYHNYKPSEHMMKEVAMIGCTALLFVSSFKDKNKKVSKTLARCCGSLGITLTSTRVGDSTAIDMPTMKCEEEMEMETLMDHTEEDEEDEEEVNLAEEARLKSIVLAVTRAAASLMFLYVGYAQWPEIQAANISTTPLGYSADGHNNNWLVVEYFLAMPLLVGFCTRGSLVLLSAALLCEAFSCWAFYFNTWGPDGGDDMERPLWWYTQHSRRHFVSNIAMAGGLLLLMNFGPGRYTVDRMLYRKRD